MLKMKRIPAPDWAKPFAVTVDKGFGEREYSLLLPHHDKMLESVHQAVEQYVNDDQKTAQGSERAETEEEYFIPDTTKLTGEYYIAWEYYYRVRATYPKPSLFRRRQPTELFHSVSVMVHCLEAPQTSLQTTFDYLGLNVGFSWHLKQQILPLVNGITPTHLEATALSR